MAEMTDTDSGTNASVNPTEAETLSTHLAIDLGASSGRAIIGVIQGANKTEEKTTDGKTTDGKTLRIEELHRFEHIGQPTPVGPVWNLTDIWRNIIEGMKSAASYCSAHDLNLSSVGVDCWGVDWALLGQSGELLSMPHCYRDPQNDAIHQRILEKIGGFEWLYGRTGIQLMAINTIFQISARYEKEPKLFDAAAQFVFIPDLFHYWISGEVAVERTVASTSALLNIQTQDWDRELIERLGIPQHLFGSIADAGTKIGHVREAVLKATGLTGDIAVVLPASHDTASAIAAVPAKSNTNWAYLSSGTWSLLGAELAQPVTTKEACEFPFTNELGVNGTVRFLKNITGLWIIQELRRDCADENGNMPDFSEMMQQAENAEAFQVLFDTAAPQFLQAGEMSKKIADYGVRSGQAELRETGEFVRSSLESLALCYRDTLKRLEDVLGQTFDTLHVVGGGCQSVLLNQFIADAIDCEIICGPVESTAIGNVMVQAMGFGTVEGLDELRAIVRNSFDPQVVTPSSAKSKWQELNII